MLKLRKYIKFKLRPLKKYYTIAISIMLKFTVRDFYFV